MEAHHHGLTAGALCASGCFQNTTYLSNGCRCSLVDSMANAILCVSVCVCVLSPDQHPMFLSLFSTAVFWAMGSSGHECRLPRQGGAQPSAAL